MSTAGSPLPVTRDNLRRGGLAAWVAFLLLWIGGLLIGTLVSSLVEGVGGPATGWNGGVFVVIAVVGTIPAAVVAGLLTLLVGVPLSALLGWLLRRVVPVAPHLVAEFVAGVLVSALPLGVWSLTATSPDPWSSFWSTPLVLALLAIGGAASAAGWLWAWRRGRRP